MYYIVLKMTMAEHNDKGKLAEVYACDYLRKNNFFILERNWRWKKAEIDIIAHKDNMIVFAEVKFRTSGLFGAPEEFVTDKKMTFVIQAANRYMEEKEINKEMRFDILSVTEDARLGLKINHFEDAFWPGL